MSWSYKSFSVSSFHSSLDVISIFLKSENVKNMFLLNLQESHDHACCIANCALSQRQPCVKRVPVWHNQMVHHFIPDAVYIEGLWDHFSVQINHFALFILPKWASRPARRWLLKDVMAQLSSELCVLDISARVSMLMLRTNVIQIPTL